MCPAFPDSDYYGPSAPFRRHQLTVHLPAATLDGRPDGRPRNGSRVHHVPVGGIGAQLFPCSLVTGTPQTFPVTPETTLPAASGSRIPVNRSAPAAARPISTRLEPVPRLRGFNHWFTRVTPLRLACRTRAVWWCRPVPSLSGLLPARRCTSSHGLPSATPTCCDRPAVGPCTPPAHMAPRGAPSRRGRRRARGPRRAAAGATRSRTPGTGPTPRPPPLSARRRRGHVASSTGPRRCDQA
jgi:hypothetical protein